MIGDSRKYMQYIWYYMQYIWYYSTAWASGIKNELFHVKHNEKNRF